MAQQAETKSDGSGENCTKLHEVVSPEHFQVLRQVMVAERNTSTRPSTNDARHLDLWLNTFLPSEDMLWQLLGQLTHAKHQLTRTRWRTHDALIRQALRNSMDLAISEAAYAASSTESSTSSRRSISMGHAPLPNRRPRTQVTKENKEVFEMWRQRMQKTESLVRSVRDEWAKVMNQRMLVMLQV